MACLTFDVRQKMKKIAIIAFSMALEGCLMQTHALKTDVGNYHGDGAIEDISIGSLLFRSAGFRITLPVFQGTAPIDHLYQLGSLPATKEKNLVILFQVPAARYQSLQRGHDQGKGRLRYELLDKSNRIAYQVELNLDDAIWAISRYQVAAYPSSGFYFGYDPGQSYSLHLSYTPGTKPFDDPIAIVIESGGIK